MKCKIVVLLLLVSFSALQAQPGGFLGKRVIFKTNILDINANSFNGFNVEFVVNNRFTFLAGVKNDAFAQELGEKKRYQTDEVTIVRGDCNGTLNGRETSAAYKREATLSGGETSSLIYNLGARAYFSNLGAPYGLYTDLNLFFGTGEFSNYRVENSFYNESIFGSCIPPPSNYAVTVEGQSSILMFDFPSIGYQFFINKYISLDLKISMRTLTYDLAMNVESVYPKKYYLRPSQLTFTRDGVKEDLNILVSPNAELKIGLILF